MSEIERRIRLAEAMYETEENSLVIGASRELMWLTDENGKAMTETIRAIPDPFTDANDCEALIRFMAEKHGTIFTIWYPCADQTSVCCSRDGYITDRLQWHGEDWKQGVCELALRVLDTDREGQ